VERRTARRRPGSCRPGAAGLIRERYPECDVRLRDAQMIDLLPRLRDGETDPALGTFPIVRAG